MPYIKWIVCKKCEKEFYINEVILNEKIQLHCPYCGTYFWYFGDSATGLDDKKSS